MTDAPLPVADAVLVDLHRRLLTTRHVTLPSGVGWDRGTDPDYLAGLLTYWVDEYDWRPHERRILGLPWVGATVGDLSVRAVHQRAADPDAPVVVLLHGWPDSVLRFAKVLPLLTDLHVVVPALPGYPFAEPLTRTGMSSAAMADAVAGLLAELGHHRYVVSGGDIGSGVAEAMAAAHPDRVGALHFTNVPFSRLSSIDPAERTDVERDYLARLERWRQTEGGYQAEQSTKPHTLAVGLGDSPAGLAAWIAEKLRSWSDCGGDVETVFPRDDLLTWVTSYWVTGAIGTSFSPYVEPRRPVGDVVAPTAVTLFPGDLVNAPRSYAERFLDVRVWQEASAGGHFGAWEQPEVFVAGLRAAVDLLGP